MKTYVALLRGINVGGKNMVAMPRLKALFGELGHTGVTTYIQSGNVVFQSRSTAETRLVDELERAIVDRFAVHASVVLRSAGEMADVARNNPFLSSGQDITKLQVLFLSGVPSDGAVQELDPQRSPPDEFTVKGREIYMSCPNGFARTRLTGDYFERVLGVKATGRNWRTVTTLAEWAANVTFALQNT